MSGRDPLVQTGWPALRARLFHLYFLLTRPMTLGVRGLVLDADGRVFLIRHTYVPGWHLPGGGVERGETMREALERELAEEGNFRLTAEPQLCSIHLNRGASRRDHVGVYLVTAFEQDRPRAPDREIAEAGFFSPDALPPLTTPGTLRRIAEIVDGRPSDRFW